MLNNGLKSGTTEPGVRISECSKWLSWPDTFTRPSPGDSDPHPGLCGRKAGMVGGSVRVLLPLWRKVPTGSALQGALWVNRPCCDLKGPQKLRTAPFHLWHWGALRGKYRALGET